jgi:hypothetical protein
VEKTVVYISDVILENNGGLWAKEVGKKEKFVV